MGEKVSPYSSLSVVHIFSFMGKKFQDFHFYGKKCSKVKNMGKLSLFLNLPNGGSEASDGLG